jgi:hypothetical protein
MDRMEGMVVVGDDTDEELVLWTPKKTDVGCFEEYGLALYQMKRYFGTIMRWL